jgi:hypothetical protein
MKGGAGSGLWWDRPPVIGVVYGVTALAYTAAYVTFVSPYGLFIIPAGVLVASATAAATVSGVLVRRLESAVDPLSSGGRTRSRGCSSAG